MQNSQATINRLFGLTDGSPPLPDLPSPPDRKRIRKEARVSLEAAAVVVGVSWAAIYRWERSSEAQTPGGRTLLRYLKFLASCQSLGAGR